jgi:hypothetical protein
VKTPLDKLGSFGALIAAAACPICFPKLALVGAFIGLGGLAAYEAQFFIAAQVLVLVAVASHGIAHRRSPRPWRLGLALSGAAAFFAGIYIAGSELIAYLGLAALAAASLPRFPTRRYATLTCPQCGHRRRKKMPTDACQFFYECSGCGAVLRPKPGDCCVFCSYGSMRCPPRQIA